MCTSGHKFYLPENKKKRDIGECQEHESYYHLSEKWVRAIDLKTNDKVLLENGKYGIIRNVTLQQLETPETTYNFEVEDYHTYYVGNDGILTHNTGNCGGDHMLKNIEYTDKVKSQMLQDIKHGFPSMIDDMVGMYGNIGNFTSGDGVVRMAVELPGSINGEVGIFQYIIEADGVIVNHRFFVIVGKSLLEGS